MKSSLTYSVQGNQAYWPWGQKQAVKSTAYRTDATEQRKSRFSQWVRAFFNACMSQLTTSSEVVVWKAQSKTGDVLWSAVDRRFNREIHRVSEADLRVWIEERYSC